MRPLNKLTRRNWLKMLGLLGIGSISKPLTSCTDPQSKSDSYSSPKHKPVYKTYFGDLHNHNEVGYARGSLRRAYEIARSHLDFFAFTPHAHWHDISTYSKGIEKKWIAGFEVTKTRWPEVLDMNREFDEPLKFVVIPGYEWHSTSMGDYHVLFPDLDAELALFDELKDLQQFAKKRGCIMIPHHPANPAGHRGAALDFRDPDVSPVLETYSEWGNADHDRAPYPYKRHTEGGRWTKNTLQYLLSQGHRMGIVASTDDHLGFPGGYREGLAAVKTNELTRKGVFDAIRNRRTYAVTGDRIELDFYLNEAIMGQEIAFTPERKIDVNVTGWNQVDQIEILKNNRVIHRDFPMDRIPSSRSWQKPVLIRFDYGWGPWPALGWDRIADWDFEITIENGTLETIHPCFAPGPLDEARRDKIVSWNGEKAHIISFTSLKHQVDDFSQKAVILKILGDPETRLTISLKRPTEIKQTFHFKDLAESNSPLFTRDFPWESAMVQRIVFEENYKSSFSLVDKDDGKENNWYYARVEQCNDQFAWSSPIWVDKKVKI
ncbi:DUF3604 domain-containing protein [Bacteroidota bacterium]